MSMCEMAKLFFCRKASMGYCNAKDKELDRCPYLKAISEIARLSAENRMLEDRLTNDGK